MYVLDESSYLTDRNTFHDRDDAVAWSREIAERLGRPINVYELMNRELHFSFRAMPTGEIQETNPLTDPPEIFEEGQDDVPVLGMSRKLLDEIAETLEARGRVDLAAQVDLLTSRRQKHS